MAGALREAATASSSPRIRGSCACSRRSSAATATQRPPKAAPPPPAPEQPPVAEAPPPKPEIVAAGVAAAMALVKAIRMHGHLAARLDLLGSNLWATPPSTKPGWCRRSPPSWSASRRSRSASTFRRDAEGRPAEAARGLLRHDCLRDRAHLRTMQRAWLRQAIESGRYRMSCWMHQVEHPPARPRVEGRRVRAVPGTRVRGQKQFSLEGVDAMVPMLDEAVEMGRRRAHEHRDRHGAPRPVERARPRLGLPDEDGHPAPGSMVQDDGPLGATGCAGDMRRSAVPPGVTALHAQLPA